MSASDNTQNPTAENERDAVELLIRGAGRRTVPPAPVYERTLAVATAAWRAKVRRQRQWRMLGALAASLAFAAGLAFVIERTDRVPQAAVGRTERIIGTMEVRSGSFSEWQALGDGSHDISTGEHLRTRTGSRAGILLANGISVRLAEASELVVESAARLRVLHGRVYFDTARGADDGHLIDVVTEMGTASDIGTQFEIAYAEDSYRLRVREGRVLLNRGSSAIDSRAGDQLTIDAHGKVERARIAPDDPQWQWVESVAPTVDIDDQPLTVLLAWVARETGRSIRFATPGIEAKAAITILHGNIRALAPLEALTVMLATTDLEHALLEDGTILIRSKANR